MTSPLVIAHRGASHGRVDNSLDAFATAITIGADLIEFDVRRTRDDQLICFHDGEVAGTPIAQLTREDITRQTGHEPPLLDEVLDLSKGRIRLDIELKENGYVDRVLNSVAGHFDADQIVVTSFLDGVIAQVKALRPDIRAGLLVGREHPDPYLRTRLSEIFPIRRAKACRADVIAMHFKIAGLGALRRTHAAGLAAYVWTVNEDEQLKRFLADDRVEAVITDVPERALALRQS